MNNLPKVVMYSMEADIDEQRRTVGLAGDAAGLSQEVVVAEIAR